MPEAQQTFTDIQPIQQTFTDVRPVSSEAPKKAEQPPSVPRPPLPEELRPSTFKFGGEPTETVPETLGKMFQGTIEQLAHVTPFGIADALYKNSRGDPSALKALPKEATLTLLSAMIPDAPEVGAAERGVVAGAKPPTDFTPAAKLVGRELTGRIPILNRLEGFKKPSLQEWADAVINPTKPPTAAPQTEGVEWGKGQYRTPISQWGKKAPEAQAVPAIQTVSPEPAPAARGPQGPVRAQNAPPTLNGESALRQILTGQDNANLLRIARSRGINVMKEALLKPGTADAQLINKIIDHFSPDELEEVSARYLENSRFKHDFGEIGAEAWKTLSLKNYFPDLKIPDAVLRRTQAAVQKAARPSSSLGITLPAGTTEGDLSPLLQESLKRARAARGQ